MNLLFLSSIYPDDSQPLRGTYNSALCRALAEQHRVHVIAPRTWREDWPRRFRGMSWQAVEDDLRAGVSVQYRRYYYVPRFGLHRSGASMWRATRPLVEQQHQEQPIDAVISYWIHPDGDAALQAAKMLGVPNVLIVGGSDVLILPAYPKRRKELQRVLRETDVIVTVSEGLREAVINLDVDPAKVRTVYQGMETDAFHSGSKDDARQRLGLPVEADVLVWVGRMVEVKRLDLLIDAFKCVAGARPNAMLCLIGSGPLRRECLARVEMAGLVDRVRFVGAVSPELLGDWYRAADLTVLSSDSEGLPNVLRESLACGTRYLTTDVGNIREIDQGKFGTFVARGNVQELSDAMVASFGDIREAQSVVDYVPRTWRNMADEIVRLLESAAYRNRSPEVTADSIKPRTRAYCAVTSSSNGH